MVVPLALAVPSALGDGDAAAGGVSLVVVMAATALCFLQETFYLIVRVVDVKATSG